MKKISSKNHIDWFIFEEPQEYSSTIKRMNDYVEQIISGKVNQAVWLLEHQEVYTAGTSANDHDLLDKNKLPVIKSKRGGQYTYHGKGQRIAYVMLDLHKYGKDVSKFVHNLESWIIRTLDDQNIKAFTVADRVGVWVKDESKISENKICALGVHVKRWITSHGIALNINTDLEHYSGIVPCGISAYGVTSIKQENNKNNSHINIDMNEVDTQLYNNFYEIFKEI